MKYSGRSLFPNEPDRWQLQRRRLLPPPRKAGQYTYDQFLQWAADNGKKTRPIGFFEAQTLTSGHL
jgi:hypothetical protein